MALELKILDELTLLCLNEENGVKRLIEYMNILFKNDVLSKLYESHVNSDRFVKNLSVKMKDYEHPKHPLRLSMNMKELHTSRIQKPIVLPPAVIAFKVLDSSDIDTQDSLIVLTGVIY